MSMPPFVHTLSSLTVPVDEPEWEGVDLDEINRQCDEIRYARAVAEVTGRNYIVAAAGPGGADPKETRP